MVPIVAITANAFSQDRRDCMDAGMNGFLAKPMTRDGLVEAILAALQVSSRPVVSDNLQLPVSMA
jgi:CheY-like chemotaxis protein